MDLKKLAAIVASVVLLLLIVGASAAVLYTYKLSAHGRIKGVGVEVYGDPGGSALITEINWGILEPGENKSLTAYIRNKSNVPVVLYMAVENWFPVGSESYVGLSWDYNFTALDVDELRSATFTLSVSPDITGIVDFSFDIVITATG